MAPHRLASRFWPGVNADTVLDYIGIARRAVADRLLGYTLIIADKP